MTQITSSLLRQFESSRIVFWIDTQKEWSAQFEAIDLPGIEKLRLGNQEFGFKRRALRLEPAQKFLVYRDHAVSPEDNWLLDMELGFATFQADPTSLWMLDVGLDADFREVVKKHEAFFKDESLREAMKIRMRGGDSLTTVMERMVASCVGVLDPGLEPCCEALLKELAQEKQARYDRLSKAGMAEFFWSWIEKRFGYKVAEPTVLDLCLKLFREANAVALGDDGELKPDALVFLRRFRDNRQTMEDFRKLSKSMASLLGIQATLEGKSWKALLEHDWFQFVDQKILIDLVQGLLSGEFHSDVCQEVARKRANSLWFEELSSSFNALEHAETLLSEVATWKPLEGTASDLYRRYEAVEYRIDQNYRKFLVCYRKAGQPSYLQELQRMVEGRYVNGYLIPHSEHWQSRVDEMENWSVEGVVSQRQFFSRKVSPYLEQARRKKLCVVISDALRYEVAEELKRRLNSENMYEADLDSCLGCLPSYTQLGMASLLPPGPLEITPDGSTNVRLGGVATGGLEARGQILSERSGVRCAAIKHDELMKLGKNDSREWIKDHDLVYVYHNKIDAVGDKRDTEEQLAEAVDTAVEELVLVIKKLVGGNANNILVTADHGFQYQYSALEESDFSSAKPEGTQILTQSRRFVMGTGLRETDAFRKWTASQLGMEGLLEFLIPKAALRLRLSGAGSRFVHGGASLQEVVVPVLAVNKKRTGDIEALEIDLLTSTNLLTSNLCHFTLYQRDPVTEKMPARTLRATLYERNGTIALSDSKLLRFDSVSELARDREVRVSLLLGSKADAYNGQDIVLKLEEPIVGSDQFTLYRSATFTLRKSFTNDFDF